jgi:hypothetical protein
MTIRTYLSGFWPLQSLRAVQYRTAPRISLPYTDCVIPPDADAKTQPARIEQLIERYRKEKRRQVLRRALKLWRKTEADRRLAIFELPPERVH